MAQNDVYQAQLFYNAFQKQFITTLHFRETQADDGPHPAKALNLAIFTEIVPSFLALLSGTTILGCIKTRIIVGSNQAEDVLYLLDQNGTQPGQPIPGSSALRLNTGATVQGRPNRGSLIISGISEADIVNGVFRADLTTNRLATFIEALQGGATGTGTSTGVWEVGYMSRAPVEAGDPLLSWPGSFVNPTVWYSTGIPVVQRSRQGTHTARRLT